ncbi:metalloprotease family protein [Maledivibacter halophilus]|uniref:Putative zincin peptidase n=1 Tax=Maledivibacter halophilus TaxID=36842 RepID=A0A1T5M460_9FIRM|nr:metalloprotease family protein [Maledivibacter halophilus]SKC82976.1 Putative zincin peptidase [Maledivibacter halophilus]
MIIPGQLITIATFPGVIIHEVAHQLFCRLANVAVLDVCYFRVGNPSGYVIHEKPRKISQHILIGIGPFILNTLIGALIAMSASFPVFRFHTGGPLDYIFIWLGVSIAMHSFPSTGDAKSIWEAIKSKETNIFAKIIGTPIVGLIYLGALGSVAWLDLFYAMAVALLIPNLIINLLI